MLIMSSPTLLSPPVFGCLAAAVLALLAAPVHANDLVDVYREAVDHDAVSRSLTEQALAQRESLPRARAALLPRISASLDASRERVETQAGAGPAMVERRGNLTSAGIGALQPLWDLSAFREYRAAGLDADMAGHLVAEASQDLLLRAGERYFGVLSAADQLATNIAERDAFAALLAQARGRESTGVGPRSDVTQAQSFYDATLQGVIDAENLLEDARRALQELTGSYRMNLAPLRAEIPLRRPDPDSAERWLERAAAANPSLLAIRARAQAAQRRIGAAQAQGLPVVGLRGNLTRSRPDATLGSDEDAEVVGITVTWPLLQGGAVASRVRESRALSRAAEADEQHLAREVERRVHMTWRGCVTGIERIRAGERAVASTLAAVDAARNNVEYGTGSEFELLNAQNLHFAARRAYHVSRFDYLVNWLRLKSLAGELTERDLVEVDALLIEDDNGETA
jgi:outer membrane protein